MGVSPKSSTLMGFYITNHPVMGLFSCMEPPRCVIPTTIRIRGMIIDILIIQTTVFTPPSLNHGNGPNQQITTYESGKSQQQGLLCPCLCNGQVSSLMIARALSPVPHDVSGGHLCPCLCNGQVSFSLAYPSPFPRPLRWRRVFGPGNPGTLEPCPGT